MSYYDGLVAVLTIILALALVICVVGAAWWLMWKVEQRNVYNHHGYCLSLFIIHDSVVPVEIPVHQRDIVSPN